MFGAFLLLIVTCLYSLINYFIMLFCCFLLLLCIKTNYISSYSYACWCQVITIISLFSKDGQVDLKVMDRVLCYKHKKSCFCFYFFPSLLNREFFSPLNCLTFSVPMPRQSVFISRYIEILEILKIIS